MGELVNKPEKTTKVKCTKCGGAGKIKNEICPTCKGSGQVELLND